MNSLSKNISANLLSNTWLMVLLLLVTPMYVWFLGVESYALIGFYSSWVAILGLLDAGISATAMREIAWLEARPREKGKIPSLLRSLELAYWSIIVILGMGILIGAYLFGGSWFQTKDLELELVREAMMLMAVSLVVQVPSGLYAAGLMGLQRQVECSGLLAFFGTLRALGAIVVLWLVAPDIRLFFLWQIVTSVLQTGVIRWILWKRICVDGHPAKFSLEVLKSVKGFAGDMTLITAMSIVMNQADKMILSRMVSLEMLGFYMLAWTIASGLSRVGTPLIQAFSPRFTELFSRADDKALANQLRLASQLMSVLILPPVAFIVFFSEPILFAWTGDQAIAKSTAPILAFMVVGTALCNSSYPALSILYSKKQLRPAVVTNLVSMIILLPLLVFAVIQFNVMGAVFIWGLYGLFLYMVFQAYGLRGIHQEGLISSIIRDFIVPCLVSLAVAGMAGYWLSEVTGKIAFVVLLGFSLIISWLAALVVCRELFATVMEKLKWKTKTGL